MANAELVRAPVHAGFTLGQSSGKTHDGKKLPTPLRSTKEKNLEERVRELELKVNTHMGWIGDPEFASRLHARCEKQVGVEEHFICLDNFPPKEIDPKTGKPKKCIVYDMGIRE